MKTKGARNKTRTVQINYQGYLEVFEPQHPLAKKNGYVRQHRMIALDAGLLTDPSMEVHHKNGIKTDNRLENLEIITHAEHTRRHWKGTKRKEWTPERRAAKSQQMKGNKNWAGIGNIYSNPDLLPSTSQEK